MDTTPNTYFDLFLGYSALWGIICFLIFRISRAQAGMAQEISELRQLVGASGGTDLNQGSTGKTLKH